MDDKALNDHFERVHERYKSGSTGSSSSDWEAIPDMEQNELTASLRR